MQCRICGNEDRNNSYVIKEMMYGKKESFEYVECSKCGCLQIENVPEDLGKYYPSDYYSYNVESGEKRKVKDVLIQAGHDLIFGSNVLTLIYTKLVGIKILNKKYISIDKSSRILDVGCGSGGFLLALRDRGYKNLTGVDPFIPGDIIYGNVIVYKKYVTELTEKYDVILFQHSFEHIANPVETLKAVNRLLTDEGICILSMPTVSSFAWKKYKEHWWGIDAPRHLNIFSLKSAEYLASRCGFYIKNYYYNSNEMQFIASIQYEKGIPLLSIDSYDNNKKAFPIFKIYWYKLFSRYLNKKNMGDLNVLYLARQRTS